MYKILNREINLIEVHSNQKVIYRKGALQIGPSLQIGPLPYLNEF
jgi:hypothetical protein